MQKYMSPSRDDAYDLNRKERMCVMFLTNVTSAFIDSKEDLSERLTHIDGGQEMMEDVCDKSLKLLNLIRETIPVRQRISLNNTVSEYEVRLVPKYTPRNTAVVVDREEFRTLVNAAQIRCRECVCDSEEAKKCDLYKLLVTTLPLDHYPEAMLCPYNMAEWEN